MDYQTTQNTKYCKFCAAVIPMDAVICTACGRQVEKLEYSTQNPNIIINNASQNVNSAVNYHRGPFNKWVALLLCFFLGMLGAHKFYEGKIGMGILYIFTCGLFGIGWFVDLIVLIFKPDPYYI